MLAGSLELFLVALGLIYFAGTTAAGLRVLRLSRRASHTRRKPSARRAGRAAERGMLTAAIPGLGPQAGHGRIRRQFRAWWQPARATLASWLRVLWHKATTADSPAPRASVLVDPADRIVYFIVPCLNEERVIEDSVRNLLTDPRGIVVVVDDASDDRTGKIAAAVDPGRVIVVRRELPDARVGKGPALNAGFDQVLQDAASRGFGPSRVTVCVMDADGRLSDGALDAVLPLFADERVGGVQLPVRIRRVRGSILTLLQDLEFWGVCAIAQLGRIGSGTVSLGGNGQFTRLAALLELGRQPWRAQLTEDLDLALAMATAGWRLTSTPEAYVTQQGLTGIRALINQRTRWYQGHMQAGRWLPGLWTSRRLSHLSMLELTLYLLVPWALVLPWSIIFNYNLVLMALWVAGWVSEPGLGHDMTERILTVAIWYSVSCIPIWMAGYLYSRQRRKAGPIRALLLGHLLLFGNYITYVACWRAFARLLVGANGWQKTQRHRERTHRATRRAPRSAPAPAQAATAATVAAAAIAAPATSRRVTASPVTAAAVGTHRRPAGPLAVRAAVPAVPVPAGAVHAGAVPAGAVPAVVPAQRPASATETVTLDPWVAQLIRAPAPVAVGGGGSQSRFVTGRPAGGSHRAGKR